MDSSKSLNDVGVDEALLDQGDRSRGGSSILKNGLRWSTLDGRRLLFATCACLAAASLFGLLSVMVWVNQSKSQVMMTHESHESHESQHLEMIHPATTLPPVSQLEPKPDLWGPLAALRGPPTEGFRDNLRNDTKYISSWPSAGWTNDVMAYANLIYLARLTDRVAIIPQFIPSHVGGSAGNIDFGAIFNTTRLGESIGIPVIEWRDVKEPGGRMDDLGCWSVWEPTQYDEDFPRRTPVLSQLNLDVSYTRAPNWIKLYPGFEHDKHTTFWALASIGYPDIGNEDRAVPRPSPQHNLALPPDDHLLCYDYLYYVCALRPFEFQFDYSPAWRYAAQYMRWTDRLEQIADTYVRRALEVPEGTPTPQYIAIHVRHHDFQGWCGDVPVKDCFAPVSVIARRVRDVQEELISTKGLHIRDVVITSDEDDPEWWADVNRQGWKSPNHTNTESEYGRWYPVLIDAVIQSNGVGFIGTDRSTMSEMGRRRSESWHGGVTRMVKWGYIGADDH